MPHTISQETSSLKERKLRLFIIASIPVFLICGVVINKIQPENYDPFWIRLIVAGAAVAGLGLSYFVKNPTRFLNWLLLSSAYVLTTHSYYLLLENQFVGFSATILVTGIVLQALPSRKTTLIYLGFILAFLGFCAAIDHPAHHRENLFVFSSLGILLPGLLFKHYYFQVIDYLRTSESEKTTILESMSDGLTLIDRNRKIIAANSSACKILGLTKDEILGHDTPTNSWSYIDELGTLMKPHEFPSSQVLNSGIAVQNVVIGIQYPDDSKIKWLNVSSVPLFENNQNELPKAVVTTFQDITVLREAQKQNTDNQMKLATASKLTSLGEMASGIAHEINNPLAIIQGKVYQIAKILKGEEKLIPVQEHLTKIEETLFRIQKIIQGLRAFARQADNDPFEASNFKSIIADTMALCGQKMIRANIVVTVDLEPDLNLDCRSGQICQILMNLLQNASDAVAHCEHKRIDIKAYHENSKIFLKVYDSGPGVPAWIQQKIMQPFFTTKDVGKGTGLGLSISMGIAQQHHGNLYLDIDCEKTCFVLELPVHQNKNIDDFQVA